MAHFLKYRHLNYSTNLVTLQAKRTVRVAKSLVEFGSRKNV